ncbi:MAG: glycosyltransferase, partial [Candidatus Kerfeldbacteria bacterium]|nr:glycosyltransferase [Candidatus Kerfeldbacteria bacterium]
MTRIARHGHRVDIYTMKWWDGPVDRQEDGLWLHGVVPLRGLYTQSGRRSIWQALWFGCRVMPSLMRADFDLLDVDHMPFFPLFSSRLVAWLRRKPMSATWHEVWGLAYWNSYLSPLLGWIAYVVEKLSVWTPNRIISDSKLTTDRL